MWASEFQPLHARTSSRWGGGLVLSAKWPRWEPAPVGLRARCWGRKQWNLSLCLWQWVYTRRWRWLSISGSCGSRVNWIVGWHTGPGLTVLPVSNWTAVGQRELRAYSSWESKSAITWWSTLSAVNRLLTKVRFLALWCVPNLLDRRSKCHKSKTWNRNTSTNIALIKVTDAHHLIV